MNTDIIEFLQQSNYIEGVYDGLDDAVKAWKYISKQKEMSLSILLKTHKLLMKNRNLEKKYKGKLRDIDVMIGGHMGLNPLFLKEALEPLLMNCWLFPNHWKEHHVRFESIHPFVDGNGRVGRILMNWERIKAKLPILIIREEERFDYYQWFKN